MQKEHLEEEWDVGRFTETKTIEWKALELFVSYLVGR